MEPAAFNCIHPARSGNMIMVFCDQFAGHSVRKGLQQKNKMAEETTKSAIQARRFMHAREAQAKAVMEDYVEMIGDLIEEHGEARVADIAERMGVAHPTATKAISRLKKEGLAISRPYRGVFLTDEGSALACKVRKRHRSVVSLLVAVGVPREMAEIDAEGIEHHVSYETLKAFEAFIKKHG